MTDRPSKPAPSRVRRSAPPAASACAAAALAVVLGGCVGGCLPDPGTLDDVTVTFDNVGADGPFYIELGTEDGGGGEGTASAWDLKVDGWSVFLNGGESGSERAGGIDMELLDLEMQYDELVRKNQLLYFFFLDSYACALSDWWWYALDGTHTLFSNYHTYVVRRGDRDFAVQMLDYYQVIDGTPVAGYPEFRWSEIDPAVGVTEVFVDEVDATAGGLGAVSDDPDNKWTYFSFDDGVLELSDSQSLSSDAWDLGFKRFNVKSNSGPSGPAGVLTVDFDRARGESAEDVLDFTAANQESWFEDRAAAWVPTEPEPFQVDAIRPVVRRWHVGVPGSTTEPPVLDTDRWFLVSSRTGDEVARFRVLEFEGNDPAGPDSITLQWAVLP